MDEAEISTQSQSILENAELNKIRRLASDIPEGKPGECLDCGQHFSRLVKGLCGICRDIRQGIKR